MDRLAVKIAGNGRQLTLKNPVLTASGTFGYGLEFQNYGELEKLGGIVVKGLSLKPREGNPMPRIAETASGMLNAVGLQNCGLDVFLQEKLPRLPVDRVAVIANLYATCTDDFARLAEILSSQTGIAALEVNISCPNVSEGGVAFGQNERLAAEVTEAVCKVSGDKPVIVKLSPNVTDIGAIASVCEKSGATALSCINTISGMAVDIHTRRPRLANIIGGLSGAAIKPVALRCVWQAANAVSIPVIGLGGIRTPEDVLEFILVGAHAVQIGTANFIRPDISFKIASELPTLMDSLGINNLDEFRGSLKIQ